MNCSRAPCGEVMEAIICTPACTAIQVSMAASSLKEEKARADDREALLKETLLRERDTQDRYAILKHRIGILRSFEEMPSRVWFNRPCINIHTRYIRGEPALAPTAQAHRRTSSFVPSDLIFAGKRRILLLSIRAAIDSMGRKLVQLLFRLSASGRRYRYRYRYR